ncbi:MAG TPA: hypothetical protein VE077_06935 [Candidatus Methylomirabilis sp.]|nr:hypothetical protein [Candidatus Methylomirabilis sp.]
MKKRALIMTGLAVLAILASTRVAQAQDQVVVNIPFDFVAGSANLPAGEYTVKMTGPTSSLLLISRTDPGKSAFVPSNAADAVQIQTESKLIFNRYGERYFLSQVWTAGNRTGRQLLKSDREKEMAQSARNDDQGRVVLVANLTK